jgi:predicted dinucleotide-binding enzyme
MVFVTDMHLSLHQRALRVEPDRHPTLGGTMSTIAVIGTGRVGERLAQALLASGHDVVIGSRRDAAPDWTRPGHRVASVRDAVRSADIVINATPGDTSVERYAPLADHLAGKVLVDVSNATRRDPDGMPGGLVYPDSSLAEELQRALPATRVVKTLSTMLFTVMTDPGSLSTPATVFVSGDDADAKRDVIGLLGDLGWPSEQILDLGGVRTARGPEAMIVLAPDLLRARGMAPFALTVVS